MQRDSVTKAGSDARVHVEPAQPFEWFSRARLLLTQRRARPPIIPISQLNRRRRALARGVEAVFQTGLRATMRRTLPDQGAARALAACSDAIKTLEEMATHGQMNIEELDAVIRAVLRAATVQSDDDTRWPSPVLAAIDDTLSLLYSTREQVAALVPAASVAKTVVAL